MAGLGRVHEMAGGAGGGECRGDLVPDMPRLARAGDDDVPAGCGDQVRGGGEG